MPAYSSLRRAHGAHALLFLACMLVVACPTVDDGDDAPWDGVYPLWSADAKLVGQQANEHAGWSMGRAGDVDGDGIDDLLVGSCTGFESGERQGEVYLLLGPVEGTLPLSDADATLTGEQEDALAGFAVRGAGDIDGDGLDDLLVGAYRESTGGHEAGAVYVIRGGSIHEYL